MLALAGMCLLVALNWVCNRTHLFHAAGVCVQAASLEAVLVISSLEVHVVYALLVHADLNAIACVLVPLFTRAV